jgi:uncharacterized damage-inducible protein DinB
MLSRQGEKAQFGHDHLCDAFPAEAVTKFKGYYLPWIKEALESADDDLVWKRPNEGVSSIGNLLLHLEGNVRQWLIHGLGGAEDNRDRDSEFSADAGAEKWSLFNNLSKTVLEACEVILKPRTDEEWLRPVRIQSFDTNALNATFHVAEHFAYHTGQIVTLVKSAYCKDLKFYEL